MDHTINQLITEINGVPLYLFCQTLSNGRILISISVFFLLNRLRLPTCFATYSELTSILIYGFSRGCSSKCTSFKFNIPIIIDAAVNLVYTECKGGIFHRVLDLGIYSGVPRVGIEGNRLFLEVLLSFGNV